MGRFLPFLALGAAATVLAATGAISSPRALGASSHPRAQHVLLLSVDGMHQSDLEWWVRTHPSSPLAMLAHRGVEFTHAVTPFPSDSFPGMVGQVTGGNPRTTGIYYDDSWNRALLPAGTTDCAGVAPGVEVTYFEQLDRNPLALDAGEGLAGLPKSILGMTSNPRSVIDPSQLPVDPQTCEGVLPHQYIKVNTVFEVIHAAGMRTAWSDKHPAYEVLNGPSGSGIDDLFTPEINSDAPTPGSPNDWTTDNALTMQYDGYKAQAVLNEINGFDHSGTMQVGTPAIFGMNFQTVSTAQKLPTSDGLTGGYEADGLTPGPLLQRALAFVDAKVGAMVDAIYARHLQNDTVIILSAKHGQSPQTPSALTRIDDGPILDGIDAAWNAAGHAGKLVAFAIDDDGMLIWLTNRSPQAEAIATQALLNHSGIGNDIAGNPKPYSSSGLAKVYAGPDAAAFIGVPFADARVPDLVGISQYGVVYTGKKKKIAEHGGDDPQDRDVPLVLAGAGVPDAGVRAGQPVETTQIAPTILQLLGLDPNALQAVQQEGTAVLPTG